MKLFTTKNHEIHVTSFKSWPWSLERDFGPWNRSGGGWRWKLGIAIGGKTVLFDLIIGTIWLFAIKRPT